jgi:hypothetical protein
MLSAQTGAPTQTEYAKTTCSYLTAMSRDWRDSEVRECSEFGVQSSGGSGRACLLQTANWVKGSKVPAGRGYFLLDNSTKLQPKLPTRLRHEAPTWQAKFETRLLQEAPTSQPRSRRSCGSPTIGFHQSTIANSLTLPYPDTPILLIAASPIRHFSVSPCNCLLWASLDS